MELHAQKNEPIRVDFNEAAFKYKYFDSLTFLLPKEIWYNF